MNAESLSLVRDAETETFESLIERACVRLETMQIEHSVKRLRDYDSRLDDIERELNAIIQVHRTEA